MLEKITKMKQNNFYEDLIGSCNLQEKLLKIKEESEKHQQIIPIPINIFTPNKIPTLDKYIILEGKVHGIYSYPDLLVPIERTHFNEKWNSTHQYLKQEDSLMLTIRQYADFLNLLKSGNAYSGTGRKLTQQIIDSLLDEILAIRSPWRAEYLDAKFGSNTITYHKINPDGSIQEVTEPLEKCIMEDKRPGIDLGSWLSNATYQGLPKPGTQKGSLCYWPPKKDRVARFYANSGRAFLNCDGDHSNSGSALGVRAAKIKR